MIGGCDVTITSSIGIEEIVHHAAEAILSRWPEGVIEAADGKLLQLPELFGINEVFVYRDPASQRSWTANGWTPANCMSMIHLLAGTDGTITCVVEEKSELGLVLEAIRTRIQQG